MAKVSVILPVYNAEGVLRRCLDALAAQTFRDFEVIAVDDGSTDGSGALLDAYAADFPLRVRHQANGGASAARNVALELAQGEYVQMVDADDWLHPRMLELAVAAADASGADFAVVDYRYVQEAEVGSLRQAWCADAVAPAAEPIAGPALRWFVGNERLPGLWQFLFRRASLGGRRFVPGIMYEDNPFIFGYLAGAVRGVHVPVELYCYVAAEGSVMHRTSLARRMFSLRTVMRILRRELSDGDYHLLVGAEYFRWMKLFWRTSRRESADFFGHLVYEGLVRRADLPFKWWCRFRWAAFRSGVRPFGRRRYGFVCSLGDDCGTAAHLRRHRLRQVSSPFDWNGWMASGLRGYVDYTCDGFRDFLRREWIVPAEMDSFFNDPGHVPYRDVRTGIHFAHDFPAGLPFEKAYAEVREKYDRRIARFLETLRTVGKVLFVHHRKNGEVTDEELVESLRRLRAKFGNEGIDLLVITHADSDETWIEEIAPGAWHARGRVVDAAQDLMYGDKKVCDRIYGRIRLAHGARR